jgi:hypothetical protein
MSVSVKKYIQKLSLVLFMVLLLFFLLPVVKLFPEIVSNICTQNKLVFLALLGGERECHSLMIFMTIDLPDSESSMRIK